MSLKSDFCDFGVFQCYLLNSDIILQASLDNLANIEPEEKTEEKKAKVTFDDKDKTYIFSKTEPIVDKNQLESNISLYGLQKHAFQQDTVYSKVRDYFWGVGKSIKSIFKR